MKLESQNPMLVSIVADPEKVSTLAPEAVAGLRGELARIDSLLLARLMSASGRALPR